MRCEVAERMSLSSRVQLLGFHLRHKFLSAFDAYNYVSINNFSEKPIISSLFHYAAAHSALPLQNAIAIYKPIKMYCGTHFQLQ